MLKNKVFSKARAAQNSNDSDEEEIDDGNETEARDEIIGENEERQEQLKKLMKILVKWDDLKIV